MEDDEESRNSLLLYCDEGPLDSTPPPTTISSAPAHSVYGEKQLPADEVDDMVMRCKARERSYSPRTDYLDHLLMQRHLDQGLSSARSKSVHYILYACSRLGLAAATAFNAVNYLDRFLSINCHLSWEVWMVEVVGVACLSVACKLDEVTIPSLHDLQMEEVMSHSFRPTTIRDMELTLLKALQWRLACVTPMSFLELLLPTLAPAAASRCTNLLLRSLSEPALLRFDASAVASSAIRFAVPLQECHVHLISPLCQLDNETVECFKIMNVLYTSFGHHKYSDQQWSPISVIPFENESTVNSRFFPSAVSRRLFGRPTPAEDKPHIEDMN